MSNRLPGEEHRAHIEKLARQLKEKMEKYFLEPPQDARIAELKAIRTEIEQLGFLVQTESALALDRNTGDLSLNVDVTVFKARPKALN